MNNNLHVAVIISCYNHKPFIKECIESILNQTYDNFSVWFWDNNSADGSLEEAEKYLGYEDTFNFADYIEDNRGVLPVGIARWMMVMKTEQEKKNIDYIAIVDADDIWAIDKLEKQVAIVKQNPKIKLVFSNAYYLHWNEEMVQVDNYPIFMKEKIYGNIGEKTFHDKYPPKMQDPFLGLLTKYNYMPCPSLLFEKKALLEVIGNPMAYTSAEDYDWVLKMTARFDCDYVWEPIVYYRIHEKQLTKRHPWRCTAEEIDVVRRARHFRELTKGENRRVDAHLAKLYMKLIYKEIFGRLNIKERKINGK